MTTTTVTKTLSKIDSLNKDYSIGFKRLTVLPMRVRKNFNMAYLTQISKDINKCHSYQVDFLASLNDKEYINWLRNA